MVFGFRTFRYQKVLVRSSPRLLPSLSRSVLPLSKSDIKELENRRKFVVYEELKNRVTSYKSRRFSNNKSHNSSKDTQKSFPLSGIWKRSGNTLHEIN